MVIRLLQWCGPDHTPRVSQREAFLPKTGSGAAWHTISAGVFQASPGSVGKAIASGPTADEQNQPPPGVGDFGATNVVQLALRMAGKAGARSSFHEGISR